MSIQKVREYLKTYNRDQDIIEFNESSATVALASKALGVTDGEIAKTLSFRGENGCIIVVMAGNRKIDNAKFKAEFHLKARMLTPEEAYEYTGHQVGGVCPFAISPEIPIYLDESLKAHNHVYPACGSSNSAIKLTIEELEELSNMTKWVDVTKD